MKNWFVSSLAGLALAAFPAWGEAPKPLLEEESPAISISTPRDVSPNNSGLIAAAEADLPETLWKDVSDHSLQQSLRNITGGIASPALRGLTARVLTAAAEPPETDKDLLADRADALIALGQATLAHRLIAQIPQSYRTPRQEQLIYLLETLQGSADEDLCAIAEKKLASKVEPFWQRWLILCQAKAGERDKAQLGLDLLTEQNEFSEFFQKLVQSLLSKTPLAKLPEIVFIEQAAWLHFSGQRDYLAGQKNPPLALLSLMPRKELSDAWQKLAGAYGVHADSLKAPQSTGYQPPLSGLQLTGDASSGGKRIAFLTYGLRKALELPVSMETEQDLQTVRYRAEGAVLSPAWRDALRRAGEQGRAGYAVLLLASTLTGNLNGYAPSDLALAVETLLKCGFPADASALAREALQTARKAVSG